MIYNVRFIAFIYYLTRVFVLLQLELFVKSDSIMVVSDTMRAHFEQQVNTLDRARYVVHRIVRDYGILSFRIHNRLVLDFGIIKAFLAIKKGSFFHSKSKKSIVLAHKSSM